MRLSSSPANALQVAVALEGCQRLEEIQQLVRAFATPLGYHRFALFSISASEEGVVEHLYWLEGEWLESGEAVDLHAYMRECPMAMHIRERDQPFFWSKTVGAAGEQYRIVRHPEGPGRHGLQVPVYGPLGLEGAMSFGGDQIDASAHTRVGLALIAAAAFHVARRLMEMPVAGHERGLTGREREVLEWVSRGWRHADIATTLKLSVRTVENHLRSARRRLGVATTAEAVRVAIRNRDIEG
ncbi:PA1136 family autoinducer-binding transcriptional regulator [Aeromonas jandaei]|uniref:PA1136 family autoinducer-binding transcriptional regulator n=1 Tax=Aeromonas jandaei TaxID=650 RepID=UPI003F7A4688